MSDNSYQQAKTQLDSIRELVHALDTDFDRLAELQEQQSDYETALKDEDEDAHVLAPSNEELEELSNLEEQAAGYLDVDAVEEAIQQDPLDVQVRSGWHTPGDDMEPEDFYILLATGGPAVRIRGELDEHLQPCRAWIEHQDWFEPWQDFIESDTQDVLLSYCSHFYFG